MRELATSAACPPPLPRPFETSSIKRPTPCSNVYRQSALATRTGSLLNEPARGAHFDSLSLLGRQHRGRASTRYKHPQEELLSINLNSAGRGRISARSSAVRSRRPARLSLHGNQLVEDSKVARSLLYSTISLFAPPISRRGEARDAAIRIVAVACLAGGSMTVQGRSAPEQ